MAFIYVAVAFIYVAVAFIYVAVATIAAVEVAGYFHFAVKAKFAGLETEVRRDSMELTANAAIGLFLDKTGISTSIDECVVQVLKETEQLSGTEVSEVRDIVKLLHRASESK